MVQSMFSLKVCEAGMGGVQDLTEQFVTNSWLGKWNTNFPKQSKSGVNPAIQPLGEVIDRCSFNHRCIKSLKTHFSGYNILKS